ncbi:MSP (Major sperm protein) domain-containing protein [Ditylenchus destructor]|uniref:Major sperm protein n=1 Tax=Ditylenchus destructor TaxID=166010 RepID=A0AAD4MM10_9BILA|nr:MSP (Major sperm protein) domain-containing protein [Ditylenchus destructor]
MPASAVDVFIADVRRIIHDQKFFVARGLKWTNQATGANEDMLAAAVCSIAAVYLIDGEHAQLLANLILGSVPLLLTFVFVDECPAQDLLLLHWSCFGASVILDSIVKKSLPGYYLLKVMLFACLYMKPTLWADKMIAQCKAAGTCSAVQQVKQKSKDDSVSMAARFLSQQNHKVSAVTSSQQIETAISDSVPAQSPAYLPEDAMVKDDRHALTPTTSDEGLDAQQAETPVNLNDMIFKPEKQLVFNAPFDATVSYYVTVENTSKRHIAYAIKGNAIPRIYCVPPYGILKPGQKEIVAVNVQSFDPESINVSRDRIAFDYIFCPPETKKFSHRLFSGNEIKRRKNILIKYNT